MNDFIKWTYRIGLVLLVVLLIDFNSNWRKNPAAGNHHMILINLTLSSLIVILLISKKIIRRL
jgi:hypothetical protein